MVRTTDSNSAAPSILRRKLSAVSVMGVGRTHRLGLKAMTVCGSAIYCAIGQGKSRNKLRSYGMPFSF